MNGNGRAVEVELTQLRLDPKNPRLPPETQGSTQLALARYIDAHYDPLRVARSITAHGYFRSEPLILIEGEEAATFVVVEGNRRLVALIGLSESEVRQSFEDPEAWEALATEAQLPRKYPAVVATSRKDVAPIIGYRHISGIEPWDPLAKARFVAALVDDPVSPTSFDEVASIVGENVGDVRALYRNERILRQAREEFGIDTATAEDEFGVFTRAMNSPALRDFIGAPPPAQVAIGAALLPQDKGGELGELVTWIFGAGNAEGKVIAESRDLTKLGRVVSSEPGREALRETGNLELADQAAGGPRARLMNRLTQARNALRAALADIDQFAGDAEVQALVEECLDVVQDLDNRA